MAIKSADQITIIDVTDAYSVMLTSEAYTFVGGSGGVTAGATCSTEAVAFCGSNQCPTVNVTASEIVCPTGVSATVENSGTSKVKITFNTTAIISAACEATIPVAVDGITVNKKFSFAVAKAGTNGTNGTSVSVKSTSVTYQVGTSGTDKPTGDWSATVPTVPNGQFLWTKTVVTYSDGKSTTSYSVSYKGTNGANGKNGADAITMSITSSNGTVFKNNAGSTVLTAHVFVAGKEQTIADNGTCGSLGVVKWYKAGNTTAVATAKTYTITATDVDNMLAITAQLEQ
ncbi:MAG: hypothetical protein ACLT50_01110 [Mediterraneibacter faecis]